MGHLSSLAVAPLAFLVAAVAAQVAIGFGPAWLGLVANASLALVMVNYALVTGRLAEEQDQRMVGSSPPSEAIAVLALVPLLALVRAAVPLPAVSIGAWAVVTGVLFLAVVAVIRPAPLRSLLDVVVIDRSLFLTALAGAGLGMGAFIVARPEPVVHGALATLAGVAVVMAAGVLWELVMRGMVLPTLSLALGGSGVVGATLASAGAAAGFGSPRYVVLMGAVALVWGTSVSRSGTLFGAAIAHGLLNVALLILGPLVLA